jgi:hypothetical protein
MMEAGELRQSLTPLQVLDPFKDVGNPLPDAVCPSSNKPDYLLRRFSAEKRLLARQAEYLTHNEFIPESFSRLLR